MNAEQVEAYTIGKAELVELLGFGGDYVAQLRGRAQFFLDGGHDERALIMLEMLEALDRRDTLPTRLAIEVLLRLGRSDAAEEKIDAWLVRQPASLDAQVAKAELHLAVGELAPAAELLGRVLQRDPQTTTEAGKRARSVAAAAHAKLGGR